MGQREVEPSGFARGAAGTGVRARGWRRVLERWWRQAQRAGRGRLSRRVAAGSGTRGRGALGPAGRDGLRTAAAADLDPPVTAGTRRRCSGLRLAERRTRACWRVQPAGDDRLGPAGRGRLGPRVAAHSGPQAATDSGRLPQRTSTLRSRQARGAGAAGSGSRSGGLAPAGIAASPGPLRCGEFSPRVVTGSGPLVAAASNSPVEAGLGPQAAAHSEPLPQRTSALRSRQARGAGAAGQGPEWRRVWAAGHSRLGTAGRGELTAADVVASPGPLAWGRPRPAGVQRPKPLSTGSGPHRGGRDRSASRQARHLPRCRSEQARRPTGV
ncbi:hypothetical protein C8D87_111166 [Lentzea atacamensis]|uniref:Uncharacterized protein n=1 Tax=Lentzea atacamensis TaxID=531938 RepID=A0ABX9E0R2_9PSEU|nr:hypothetical protein C8D87_111166 [Lentzea atacamensis]